MTQHPQASPAKPTATLFTHGRIFTGENDTTFVDAFLVEDGTITWTGSQPTDIGDNVAVHDLQGATVLPGFIDVHTHLSYVAQTANAVPCTIPNVYSIEEIITALRESPAAGQGPDVWIEGWGWDESKLAEGRPLTRHDLDRVSTTQPVYVLRSDCHTGACNTRALELAGVTADTPDPEGAAIGREADGRTPNGVLIEPGANNLALQAKADPSFDNFVAGIVACGDHFLDHGIVGCSDMMALHSPIDYLDAFRAAAEQGFRPQCNLYYNWSEIVADGYPPIPVERKTGRIKIAGVKIFLDGSMSNQTAWMRTPYRDTDNVGMRTLEDAVVLDAIEYARREGIQVSVHVMGDGSIEHLLNLVGDEEPWLTDRPSMRLEHASMLDPGLIARMRDSRMTWGVGTQIIFLFAEYEAYVANLTDEQFKQVYALRDMWDGVEALGLSGDAPATTWMDPDDVFVSVQAAVTRTAYNGKPITPEQSITAGQALMLYTGRSAKVAPYDEAIGALVPGASADFVVLTDDVFAVPSERISEVNVAQTWMSGELAFSRA